MANDTTPDDGVKSGDTVTISLTPREAELVRWIGRFLRKQEGFWDDHEWDVDDTNVSVWTKLEQAGH